MVGRQRGVLAWAHLMVLWSFGVAQPLFGILSDSPEFFVARSNTVADILLFAFGLVLGPPTVLFLIARLAERIGPAGAWVQSIFVGLLAAGIVLQILADAVGGPAAFLVLAALAAGGACGLLYARRDAARTVLTVLAPAPLVILVLFLVVSPVSKLVFGSDDVAAAEVSVPNGPPVVIVVFDEFSTEALMDRDLAIDSSRFPNFAALARDGTWYRNATTVADHTTDAVPSLLTARFPRDGELPIVSDHPNSLFTLLGGAYSMANVTEPATDVCPTQLCEEPSRPAIQKRLRSLAKDLGIVYLHRLLPDGLTESLPPVDRTFGDFANAGGDTAARSNAADADAVPEAAQVNRRTQFSRFVAGIRAHARPALHFLHVLLPHTPWQYLPGGQQYSVAGPDIPGLDQAGYWTSQHYLVRQAQQRKLLQTGFVDRLVGSLVRQLRGAGLFDRALLVLTADHGISFRPGASRRGAAGPGFPDVAGVPLFIKLPGQRSGRVDDGRATSVDVLPTIADALGVEPGWKVEGRSLLRPDRGSEPLSIAAYPDLRRVELPFADFVRKRNAAVVTPTSGGGARGWTSAFAIGPDRDLLGARANGLTLSKEGSGRIELDGTQLFASLEPDSLLLPAFVTGRLTGVAAGARIAVAVNDRVRAVAYSYDDNGETRVGAMVPPLAFQGGANRTDLYEVVGETGSTNRLRPIGGSAPAAVGARLVEQNGATTIQRPGEADIEVVDGAATGFVDRVGAEEGSIEVAGWATDAEHLQVADEVLVFADGQLVAAGRPHLERPDVALNFEQPAIELSGFRLIGASAEATEVASPDRLRVIAVEGLRASDLPLEARSFRAR